KAARPCSGARPGLRARTGSPFPGVAPQSGGVQGNDGSWHETRAPLPTRRATPVDDAGTLPSAAAPSIAAHAAAVNNVTATPEARSPRYQRIPVIAVTALGGVPTCSS